MIAPKIESTLREIFNNPPPVHGDGDHCWKISLACAQYLYDSLDSSSRTIETGCGLSTIIFALKGANHTCVVPDKAEVERLRRYCEEARIDLGSVEFCIEPSQQCLPKIRNQTFDLILIDGCHSFPSPFIDWYYLEPCLSLNGLLMIDDTNLWTARVLRDILSADRHWRLVDEIPSRTAVLQKLAEGSTNLSWCDQPYVSARSRVNFFDQSIDHLLCLLRIYFRRMLRLLRD